MFLSADCCLSKTKTLQCFVSEIQTQMASKHTQSEESQTHTALKPISTNLITTSMSGSILQGHFMDIINGIAERRPLFFSDKDKDI